MKRIGSSFCIYIAGLEMKSLVFDSALSIMILRFMGRSVPCYVFHHPLQGNPMFRADSDVPGWF